mmetsp:Transcript_111964/g.361612  ORF Transcript_111964/g.361612 Transcript_111964/m.361612 type:complete len:92 (-) Transcript_111964:25-300(-)
MQRPRRWSLRPGEGSGSVACRPVCFRAAGHNCGWLVGDLRHDLLQTETTGNACVAWSSFMSGPVSFVLGLQAAEVASHDLTAMSWDGMAES